MTQSETKTDSDIKDENRLDNDDDDDVDRMRSFDGRLNQFLHQSSATVTKSPNTRSSSILSYFPRSPGKAPTAAAAVSSLNISKRSPSTSPSKQSTLNNLERNGSLTRSRKRKPQSDDGLTHLHPKRKNDTSFSPPSRLRDTIPPNLILLFIGVNPGLMTGSTGHAYAHPSNLFWKLLHTSGITPIRHAPSDTYKLPALYSIGNTNIVERPTRDASMLSKAEMDAGVPVLEAKIAAQKPEAVALVGKSIWEAVWRVRHGGKAIKKEEFRYGWQDESENMGRYVDANDDDDASSGWDGARVFVATTTSGLAATMSLQQKQEVWNELGKWVKKRREERAEKNTSSAS